MIATALMGAPTYMSCKVAQDDDGDIYLADLEQSGVAHGLNDQRKEGVTGKCIVLITPDAERSLNTHLGISETLSTDEVDEAAIRDSEWVYLEGYLVTSPTGHAAALKTKALADQHGVRTAVSFSDPGMVKFFRDNMAAMVEGGVEMVFCNEAEALEWGQMRGFGRRHHRYQTGRATVCHYARGRGCRDLGRQPPASRVGDAC